jgi:hypothetical protein
MGVLYCLLLPIRLISIEVRFNQRTEDLDLLPCPSMNIESHTFQDIHLNECTSSFTSSRDLFDCSGGRKMLNSYKSINRLLYVCYIRKQGMSNELGQLGSSYTQYDRREMRGTWYNYSAPSGHLFDYSIPRQCVDVKRDRKWGIRIEWG